jgi:hypothetical protein
MKTSTAGLFTVFRLSADPSFATFAIVGALELSKREESRGLSSAAGRGAGCPKEAY